MNFVGNKKYFINKYIIYVILSEYGINFNSKQFLNWSILNLVFRNNIVIIVGSHFMPYIICISSYRILMCFTINFIKLINW